MGVNRTASTAEIRKAFRQKARRYHPDSRPPMNVRQARQADEYIRQLTSAHDILTDDAARAKYDARLASLNPPVPQPASRPAYTPPTVAPRRSRLSVLSPRDRFITKLMILGIAAPFLVTFFVLPILSIILPDRTAANLYGILILVSFLISVALVAKEVLSINWPWPCK